MFKVGITGNIGSGKTTVCKIFEVLGIPVFYADDEAKKVMIEDSLLITGIKQTFGNQAYFADGSLNRKYIAGIVFNNPDELIKLNALVHPATFRAFDNWMAGQKNVPYVLKEAALLFESDSYKMCNRAVMVTAPLDLRIKRVTRRDGITAAEVNSRNDRQFTEQKKLALANDVIINDDTQPVIPQVLKLHQLYLSLAQQNS
ncbi:dephospho-CoA kinase [Mucilaginibacter phyllosphaerae]|uniref:Dephospho-CoA kinase n=1 Tax=Mucilaginibacter phyllosphaerae TaxID=1812349 RepID=A0A4Y8A8D0_9SPHI|nr:dephospho-CoA kinase [Mucilaginibacter phyllosphaerae]MBB3970656.1 dephospho-CoA kinase [Mucilaginibacter phyllosphaerae]TEW64659.1 dephospho-CoA kinase [Mucilaginibacter phyllosphaerae]GGH20093.1 dephospho-CoA kinase [Mucilaginibacter phyllosphaerae]